MYELIIKDFSNIKSLIDFLKEIARVDTLKSNFGIIEYSPNIEKIYGTYEKAKKYNINLEIQKVRTFKLKEPITAKKIEIQNSFIIIDEAIKLDIGKAKAVIIHFIKEPSIRISPFLEINDIEDLIYSVLKIYTEIIDNTNRVITGSDTIFENKSPFYQMDFSSERNAVNLIELISKINKKVVINPVYEIFKKTPNYIKYFIKEILDDKELIWMLKTNQIDLS